MIVVLTVIGFAGFKVFSTKHNEKNNSRAMVSCEGKQLSFTKSPLDEQGLKMINDIEGQGLFAPPTHTYPVGHTYIALDLKEGDPKIPVYAPADGYISNVGMGAGGNGGLNGAVYVKICDGISYHFGHLNEISPDILAQTGCSADNCAWGAELSEKPLNVTAGMLLGYKGGENIDIPVLDFGAIDANSEPVSWPGGEDVWKDYVHAVCPYDYFADQATTKIFKDALKRVNTRGNLCGTLDIHVDGALQGFWFDPGTPIDVPAEQEGNHLVIGPINPTPERDYLATGSFLPHGASVEIGTSDDSRINTPVGEVHADGNKYCYAPLYSHPLLEDTIPGFVMIEMASDTQLRVEYLSSGNCPADTNSFQFTNSAFQFTRDI